jgi:uncharacterized Rmd1/YagE family protein
MVKHQNIEDESSFLLPKCNMPNNEKTKQVSSTRNVRHMFVHSPSIPTQTKISPFLASYKRRSKARQSIAKYRRTKQGGGNHYHSWKGRISVRMDVQEFDLKLLVSHLSSKSDFNDNRTGVWRITEFNDAIRLWSSPPSPPSTLPTSLIDNSTIELGCIMEQQSATTVPKSIHSDEEEQLPSIEKHMFEQPQQLQEEEEASTPEVYIFSFGAVVFWNFINEESEQSWMDQFLFDDHGDDSNDEDDGAVGERNHIDAIESANDEMSFGYGTKFYINHDMVQLQTKDCKEKLAVSFALAKSANVSIFEWRLNQAVERNSHIPEELATHGRINMSKKDLKKELGRIYLVKSGINLENDILDTPAEFWEGEDAAVFLLDVVGLIWKCNDSYTTYRIVANEP